jgi:hypothetical protein
MSARTARRPSFVGELGVALVLSLVGGALVSSLGLVLPATTALKAVVTLLAFAYLGYGLSRSAERTGRIVVVALWCVLTAGAWASGVPLGVYLVLHAAALWLVRALYAEAGLLSAGANLVLTALALAFAVWAALRTESFFIAAWCFFLLQSLHVFTPALGARESGAAPPGSTSDSAFESALRTAEEAFERLTRAH